MKTYLVVVGVPDPELATLRRFWAGMLRRGFGGCDARCDNCGGRKAAVAVSWTLRARVRSSAGVLAAERAAESAMSDSGSAKALEGSVNATAYESFSSGR